MRARAAALALAIGLSGCAERRETAHLPRARGARATFRITHADGAVTYKTTTVEEHDPATNAFRVRTVKASGEVTLTWERALGGGNHVVVEREQSWRARPGGAVERREERWDPPKVRLDARPERLVAGARWQEQYLETRRDASGVAITLAWEKTWTVEAMDEVVVVPAGRFRCLRLRARATAHLDPRRTVTTEKTYWYAPGVGKVKEVGGQTEELATSSAITAAAR
jgi:hypothetical protein